MKLSLQKTSEYVANGLGLDPDNIHDCFLPATEDDFEGLIELRKNLFESKPLWDDRSYLKWRYSFNNKTDNHNKIWLFKLDNKIVACLGVEEVTLSINRTNMRVHKVMDLLVEPEIDGKGLGVWMSLALMDKLPVLFATGSSTSSHSMISRLFNEMEHRPTYKLFTRANTKLNNKLKSALVTNMVSAPLNLALSIYQKLLYKGLPDSYSLELLDSIPPQVDSFVFAPSIQTHVPRTKEYLNWRFIENPRRKFIILGLYTDSKLIGISFSIFKDSLFNDHKDGFIVDWIYNRSSDSSEKIALLLLQETVKHLKQAKPNSISSSAYDQSSAEIFQRLGFIKRDYNQTFFTYTSDKNIEQYLYNSKLWYLTESDANTDLF